MSFIQGLTSIESTYFLPVGLFNEDCYDERLERKSPLHSNSSSSSSTPSRSPSPLYSGATTPSDRGESPLTHSSAYTSPSRVGSLRASPTFSTSPISWGRATPTRKRESPSIFSPPSSSPDVTKQKQEFRNAVENALLKRDYKEALDIIGKLPKGLLDRNWQFHCLKIQLMDLMGKLTFSDLSKFNLPTEQVWTWHLFTADICARKQNWVAAFICLEKASKNRPLERHTGEHQAWRVDAERALLLFQKEGRDSEIFQSAVDSIEKQARTPKAKFQCYPTLIGMYSFLGRFDQSQQLLDYILKSRELKAHWRARKVELIALAARGKITEALDLLDALEPLHETSGTYWLIRMQMQDTRSEESALAICQILKRTLDSTSNLQKSGEIWCERARFLMDPFAFRPEKDSPLYIPYSLEMGEEALNTALTQTPQYGDTYIEYLNLLKMQQRGGADNASEEKIARLRQRFLEKMPHQGILFSLTLPSYAASYVEIWDIIAKNIDAQHAQGVPAEPTAFGIRLSNLSSLIQTGKLSDQQILYMLMNTSQFSPYRL